MQVPVKDEHGQIRLLHLTGEVIYLQTNRSGGIDFFTECGKYTLIRRMEDWEAWLDARTSGFLRVDRGTIVNLQKQWQYSPELRALKLQVGTNCIHVPVTEQKVAQLIEMINL